MITFLIGFLIGWIIKPDWTWHDILYRGIRTAWRERRLRKGLFISLFWNSPIGNWLIHIARWLNRKAV